MSNICVVGEQDELVPTYVAWLTEQAGHNVIWLSESRMGDTWFFSFSDQRYGHIKIGDTQIDFSEIAGMYVNLHPQPPLPLDIDFNAEELETLIRMRRSSLTKLINSIPCRVANRLTAGRSNNSKPFQMGLLRQYDFLVPDWIVSNNLRVINEFSAHHNEEVVCKSVSGLRSEVSRLDENIRDRLSDGTAPIIVQKYIKGRDVRIHTIDNTAFATEISASGVDYRFAEGHKSYLPIEPPQNLIAQCCRFARLDHMIIAGFDFVVTEGDEWHCLEMNPVPSFLPYEMETKQPIGMTLIETLTRQQDIFNR